MGEEKDRDRPGATRASGEVPSRDGAADVAAFPVVAIGASAGGLDALERFFRALPKDTGMAFVVIQHLAPTQASMLTELLGHKAVIPVEEASEGAVLKPDHVYVIPPNRYMALKGGHLQLKEMPAGHRLPIDVFLRSLAAERGNRAGAVILSGTGTDGTLGAQAVKGEGGVVVAQTPDTAEYPGMPESAIGTGQADYVLPPEEIAGSLFNYFRHSMANGLATAEEPVAMERSKEFPAILALLRDRKGHDFSLYKTSTLIRRIRRRMAVHGLERYVDYVRLVREQPEELDQLFREFLIQVSSFFRDPESFQVLEERVIPDLIAQRAPDDTLRVWVPGCSTGEEAYSIAIAIQERMDERGEAAHVQIFATDIDERALGVARAGRYPTSIAADVSAERLRRFFIRRGDFYEIDKNIRQMLVFAEQNIAKDPPFSRLDLLSCRNVLIYMGPELQRRLFPLFHYALRPGGYLFLGTSETVGAADDLFETLDRRAKVYRRRDDVVARTHLYGIPSWSGRSTSSPATPPGVVASQDKTRSDVGDLARRTVLRDYAAPFVVVDENNQIVYFHGQTGRFLEPPSGVPNLDVVQMARGELRGTLRTLMARARKERREVRGNAMRVKGDGAKDLVCFIVTPMAERGAPEGLMLLQMKDLGSAEEHERIEVVQLSAEENERVNALEQELSRTKEALQATIEELETSNEELQSSNEELQSSNEELQSSNEELETSREELQSVNEELHTVNAELESKVEDLSRTNDDMNNLLASTDLGIIFLDADLRIQRFTPAATRIIPMIAGDIGRPFEHLAHGLRYAGLSRDIGEVIRTQLQLERYVEDRDGEHYLLRIRPYRTAEGAVNGAVLAFIGAESMQGTGTSEGFMQALALYPDIALVMELDGRVAFANESFRGVVEEPGYSGTPNDEARAWGADVLSVSAPSEMQDAVSAGAAWRGPLIYRNRDGQRVETPAYFAPIRDPGGRVRQVVVYADGHGGASAAPSDRGTNPPSD